MCGCKSGQRGAVAMNDKERTRREVKLFTRVTDNVFGVP